LSGWFKPPWPENARRWNSDTARNCRASRSSSTPTIGRNCGPPRPRVMRGSRSWRRPCSRRSGESIGKTPRSVRSSPEMIRTIGGETADENGKAPNHAPEIAREDFGLDRDSAFSGLRDGLLRERGFSSESAQTDADSEDSEED